MTSMSTMLPNLNFPPSKPPAIETSTTTPTQVPVPLTVSPETSKEPSVPVEGDRRSSSIAALRLKAREHEIKLEQLRQNKCNEDSSN